MGYQNITITPGYQLFTVTFKDVSNAQYDVQDVKVLNTDGTEYATLNKVRIQKLSAAGEYGTTYNYRLSKGGWCNGSTVLERGEVLFADGEGVALNNLTAGDLVLQVSGAVNLTPVSTLVAAGSYQIIGNMTPVEVDIQDVVPYDGDTVYGTLNKIRIQKLGADGEYGTTYNWRESKGGWCNGATFIGRDVVTLKPGESVAVFNADTAKSVTLHFPSPVN